MHTGRESDSVCQKKQNTVTLGFIGMIGPFQDQPQSDSGEKGAGGIDFSFHRIEPVTVGKTEYQRSNQRSAADNNAVFPVFIGAAINPDQSDSREIKKDQGER